MYGTLARAEILPKASNGIRWLRWIVTYPVNRIIRFFFVFFVFVFFFLKKSPSLDVFKLRVIVIVTEEFTTCNMHERFIKQSISNFLLITGNRSFTGRYLKKKNSKEIPQ